MAHTLAATPLPSRLHTKRCSSSSRRTNHVHKHGNRYEMIVNLEQFENWARRAEQPLHLWLFQVRTKAFRVLLTRDCANLLAPRNTSCMEGATNADVVRIAAKSWVARGLTAAAGFFKVNQLRADTLLQMLGARVSRPTGYSSRGEMDQQSKRISIAPLRVHRQVAFPDEMFQEKAASPRPSLQYHPWLTSGKA